MVAFDQLNVLLINKGINNFLKKNKKKKLSNGEFSETKQI